MFGVSRPKHKPPAEGRDVLFRVTIDENGYLVFAYDGDKVEIAAWIDGNDCVIAYDDTQLGFFGVTSEGRLLYVYAPGDVPPKITTENFRRYYSMSFPKLIAQEYNKLLQQAIDTVYTMFTGVGTMWDLHPKDVWYEKTQLCYRLLTAWYIAENYPAFVAGTVPIMGGMDIKRKKIDGVDLTFADMATAGGNKEYQELLSALRHNTWGNQALLMIRAAGKRAMLRNRRFT
jgi:hypothetical protein